MPGVRAVAIHAFISGASRLALASADFSYANQSLLMLCPSGIGENSTDSQKFSFRSKLSVCDLAGIRSIMLLSYREVAKYESHMNVPSSQDAPASSLVDPLREQIY